MGYFHGNDGYKAVAGLRFRFDGALYSGEFQRQRLSVTEV